MPSNVPTPVVDVVVHTPGTPLVTVGVTVLAAVLGACAVFLDERQLRGLLGQPLSVDAKIEARRLAVTEDADGVALANALHKLTARTAVTQAHNLMSALWRMSVNEGQDPRTVDLKAWQALAQQIERQHDEVVHLALVSEGVYSRRSHVHYTHDDVRLLFSPPPTSVSE